MLKFLSGKHIKHFTCLGLYTLLCLFIVTIEMRPGRVYQLLQMLLFQDSVFSLVLYLVVFGLTAWSVFALLFNQNRLVRIASAFVWLPFLFISLVYRFISGYNYNYADAHTALNNPEFLQAAVENYTLPITLALASVLLVGAILYLANRVTRYKPALASALLLLPAALISHWYINRTLGVVDDLPALYRVPISTYVAHKHALPHLQRQSPQAIPVSTGAKHLFLVVDESITGSALSLNGHTAGTTPQLSQLQAEIQNFGIASAFTNYSAGSNIALMSGLQQHELPDLERKALTQPNIFQYAKQAGYITYFVDMQMGHGILQNFMTPNDLKSIDHYIYVTEDQLEQPYFERDFYIAELLLALSKSPDKVFVYANKVGAHWPYARTYPPDSTFFSPVLSERSMLKDQEKSINTYYNAIRWSVDNFWAKLISGIAPQDSTFIVYTSDHGQDLSRDGISMTHASATDTAPIEANVPLWCLDQSGYAAVLSRQTPNKQTHAQIFPTLLLLQGYDPAFIRDRYGPTLYDAPPPKRTFLSGDVFGRGRSNVLPFSF